ncbi:serine hydrolase domain-containing protein [Natribacillus halophilus]|uniref:CubicO group peptidase, beta-lactamase class C family n=1 Tax=Natribacillus halophilus TaxID=549003 RepID=A0A1G8S3G6_9BACI|nr:serine hydrolase domain-containing protein [Natribacillus halophilus]SDJ23794.1 CubicO group peptidase, beta-lactamase class C family [Natribacillus halophilus]
MDQRLFASFAEDIISDYQIPGVAVGINHKGRRAYEKGFGYRDKEEDLPVTSSTVFGLASITKSFTCMAIMQLHEQGKLHIHDPVQQYLPAFKIKEATIHHFMTHTSGLPPLDSIMAANKRSFDQDPSFQDYPGVKLEHVDREPIDTYAQLLDYIASLDAELLGKPGEVFSYSNDCYSLLGAIIEKASGQSYESYVDEHILQPLGMIHTSFFPEPSFELTMLYAKRTEVYPAPIWWDAPAMRGTGGLKSSLDDMLRYTEVYLNGGESAGKRLLTAESVKAMMTPHVKMEPGKYYGYGLMITPDYYGQKLVEHGGSLKAISSLMAMVPERKLAGVVLTNLAGVPAGKILHGGLNVHEGRHPEETHVSHPPALSVKVEMLKDYEGTYRSLEGMNLAAWLEGETLLIQYQDDTYEATPTGEDGFLINVRGENEYVRFIRDDNDVVRYVAFHYRQFPKV